MKNKQLSKKSRRDHTLFYIRTRAGIKERARIYVNARANRMEFNQVHYGLAFGPDGKLLPGVHPEGT